MLRGEPVRRPTYFKFVENVGWSLDAYRALPEGVEEIPKLREMVYWVVCAGPPSKFRRLTGECGLHRQEDAAEDEPDFDLETGNSQHPVRTKSVRISSLDCRT